jgi:hypothetical protein
VPFGANKILIKRFVDLWDDPVLSVFEEVSNRLDTFVETLVVEWFSQFKNLETLIRYLTVLDHRLLGLII